MNGRGKDNIGRSLSGSYTQVSRNKPKMSVSSFMELLKGKSSIMIYQKWGNMKYKYRNQSFWCRGYYVDTAGKNDKAIEAYIKNQLKEDELSEHLILDIEIYG